MFWPSSGNFEQNPWFNLLSMSWDYLILVNCSGIVSAVFTESEYIHNNKPKGWNHNYYVMKFTDQHCPMGQSLKLEHGTLKPYVLLSTTVAKSWPTQPPPLFSPLYCFFFFLICTNIISCWYLWWHNVHPFLINLYLILLNAEGTKLDSKAVTTAAEESNWNILFNCIHIQDINYRSIVLLFTSFCV